MWELIENLGMQDDLKVDASVSLCFDDRKRGRLKAQTEDHQDVGLFLERGQVLQHGDVLRSRCGHHVRVIAKPEDVTLAKTDDWQIFSRCCYHLGNRHVPLQIGERWLSFQPDYVLEDMVRMLGMATEQVCQAFEPEKGAYSGSHSHEHSQEHRHAHTHSHLHTHTHS
jgi:urease accessory protein